MHKLVCLFLVATSFIALWPAAAQSPAAAPPASAPSGTGGSSAKEAPSKPDLFDFSNQAKIKEEEQKQYFDLDENIKVRVEPIVRSAVVDRVLEPSTIYVKAPGSSRVEVYLEPVDAPFCGKSVGQARLIGKSNDYRRNFPVCWEAVEKHKYVKLYALAYKADGQKRSRSIDLSMGGLRLQPGPTR